MRRMGNQSSVAGRAARLRALEEQAASCRACPLWQRATQTGQALFGPSFRVGSARGSDLHLDGHPVVVTAHPSAVLRSRDSTERAEAFAALVDDLRRARALAA
ncbi:MAG: hypothetical protein ACOYXM_16895 [Actinomycetota bacterium]